MMEREMGDIRDEAEIMPDCGALQTILSRIEKHNEHLRCLAGDLDALATEVFGPAKAVPVNTAAVGSTSCVNIKPALADQLSNSITAAALAAGRIDAGFRRLKHLTK